jgi:LmbE family N-acetylglucosaminyl deacetylase
MKKILIVAAHPDDEVLGCGGTAVKLVQSGHEIYTLILGEGKTSRYKDGKTEFSDELKELNKEISLANKVVGAKEVFIRSLPDNAFDSVPLLEIVKEIEAIIEQVKPYVIFTHHAGDLNIDHQLTHRAVLTAARPMKDQCVKEIYAFEVPSSTEWNSFSRETAFIPNVFVDITETIDTKVSAMTEYKSELRKYPHPRSLLHIKELAKINGTKVGLEYSENFILIRKVGEIL